MLVTLQILKGYRLSRYVCSIKIAKIYANTNIANAISARPVLSWCLSAVLVNTTTPLGDETADPDAGAELGLELEPELALGDV